MTVKILPNAPLTEKLTSADFDAMLDWFRANGIDPEQVPAYRSTVIEDDPAPGTIECWYLMPADRPENATFLEITPINEARTLAHMKAPIIEPLPTHLAEALTAIWREAVEKDAEMAAKVAGAHAAAKVWDEAGL